MVNIEKRESCYSFFFFLLEFADEVEKALKRNACLILFRVFVGYERSAAAKQ